MSHQEDTTHDKIYQKIINYNIHKSFNYYINFTSN